MTVRLGELFADAATPAEQAERLDAFKSAMADSLSEHDKGSKTWVPRSQNGDGGYLTKSAKSQAAEIQDKLSSGLTATLTKAVDSGADAGLIADLQASFAGIAGDLVKDWTPTNPVGGTGLTPYDLEGPAKLLVPLFTPLRNSIPRTSGKGNARKYKRVDSFSNAGVPGGAATLSPFFSSLTQTSTWGPTNNITLARPQKISYTGSDFSIPYVELGFSDSVDWLTQFEGLGFDDVRALSHTAALYAHMMGEERGMLYARGSQSGYAGAISAPVVSVVGSDSGGLLPAATYFVYVAAVGGFGQSAVSTVQNSGARTGGLSSAVITVTTEPTGALYYNLYVGTTTGIANAHLQTSFAGNTYTLTAYNAGGAVIAGTDNSADANSYDGLLTVQSGTQSGYFARNNAAISTQNPGVEFDNALSAMYANNGADPDEIWMTGTIRQKLAEAMRQGGNSGFGNGYRTTLETGSGQVVMGTSVSGIMNPNTQKIVDYKTHRFMPLGCALIRSTSLPLPDPHVPAPVAAVNVQDYMVKDWPDIQMTYDISTYQIGTLIHYAPAWSGLIVGLL